MTTLSDLADRGCCGLVLQRRDSEYWTVTIRHTSHAKGNCIAHRKDPDEAFVAARDLFAIFEMHKPPIRRHPPPRELDDEAEALI